MKPKKMGRPPKQPDKRHSETLLIRLEAVEKNAFREAADAAGLPLSSWIRERLRRIARKELGDIGRPVAFLPDLAAG
jgi:predicted HicB family RNase H-like nuclease